MRKVTCLLAVTLLCVGTSAFAQDLNIRVESDGNATVTVPAAGGTVNVQIIGSLTAGSEGLALWGANLTATASAGPAYNLGDQTQFLLTAPAGDMAQFDRNLGVTNPPGPPTSGYSGTPSGTDLLQLGGGTNTINNTGPTLYPVGTVPLGVGNSGDVVLASGTMDVGADYSAGDTITLTLDTGFANTIDLGETGPVYAVSAANVVIGASLVIEIEGGDPLACNPPSTATCPDADVNCDNQVNGLDIAAISSSANFGKAQVDADEPRTDVNRDGQVNGLDVAAASSSACFGQ